MLIDVADETEQCYNGNVRIARIENFVSIVGDDNTGFQPEPRKITDILSNNCGIDIDSADYLRAVFVQITKNVLAHFSATVLYNFDFFHGKILLKNCI